MEIKRPIGRNNLDKMLHRRMPWSKELYGLNHEESCVDLPRISGV